MPYNSEIETELKDKDMAEYESKISIRITALEALHFHALPSLQQKMLIQQ